MKAKARIAGHSVHQVLVVFPLGLLIVAAIFDVVYAVGGNARLAYASYLMIGAGLIGGLASAVFGAVDWMYIPRNTRAATVGFLHGVGNMIVLILFAASFALRRQEANHLPTTMALGLALGGAALVLATGWLGGELVNRLSVGIDAGAHPNAPNSLSKLPASQSDPRYTPGRAANPAEPRRTTGEGHRTLKKNQLL